MIRQLRPFYSAEELRRVYSRSYDHTRWPDHIVRVNTTIHVGRWMRDRVDAQSAADLSCGDGAILRGLEISDSLYGDFVAAPHVTVSGNLTDTVINGEGLLVDLYVLSETLEHVEDPPALLRALRLKAKALVLSTPVGEEGDGNPEHYWGWDADDVEGLMRDAGWDPVHKVILDPMVPGGYVYQIWGCV